MKKIMVICICVNVLILKGAFREDVHQRNIKFAITQFASSFTNDMMSTSYDFAAILGEIENFKSEVIRTNLLSDLTDRLMSILKIFGSIKMLYGFSAEEHYALARLDLGENRAEISPGFGDL